MRIFSFQIGSIERLKESAGQNRKAGEIALTLNRRVRRTSFPNRSTSPRPDEAPHSHAKAKQHVSPAAADPTPNTVSQFAREICATRQIRYRRFSISTSRLIDGRWIASFGRTDGSPICQGGRQAVWTTELYLAESLAIADALIRIDALATRPGATEVK